MDSYRTAMKTDGHLTTRVYRKPCPRCHLETIVRKKQMKTMSSGLHVICYQCKIDWCFMCEDLWHPGAACDEHRNNLLSQEGKEDHLGNKIRGNNRDSDECYEVRTNYMPLRQENMQEISRDHSIKPSTVNSSEDIPSLMESLESDDCKGVKIVSETFNHSELQEIPKGRTKEFIAEIRDEIIQSNSAKYINRFDDNDSIVLNFENTCDICLSNSTDDVRPCCQFSICSDCMRTYLTLTIDNAQVDITCPNHGCNDVLSEADIKRSVDGKTFLKYQQFVVNAKQDPGIKTCPSCSYITVIDVSNGSEEDLRIRCPECSLSWCFNCQAPWHRDLTCSEFQSRHDSLFKEWASRLSSGQLNARKCPTCQAYIQRNGGCDHMKCTQCGTDFCYQCGDKGIHRHNEAENGGVNNLHQTDQPVSRLNRLKAWGWLAFLIIINVIIIGSPFLAFIQSSGIHDMKSQNSSENYPSNPNGSALN